MTEMVTNTAGKPTLDTNLLQITEMHITQQDSQCWWHTCRGVL